MDNIVRAIGQQVNLVEEEDYPTAAAASMEDQALIEAMGRIVASEIELMESMEQQEQIGFDHTLGGLELGGLEEACKRLGRGLEYLVGVVLGAQIS